ncbi:hypothetical protein GPA23_20365, partial [Aromatoleum aromaticum]|nr:hypothetical protein [Aromatoleum aromaticum]
TPLPTSRNSPPVCGSSTSLPTRCDPISSGSRSSQERSSVTAYPEDAARTSHREQKADRRRIKDLERDLRRKEKALAEAAALLVL